MTSKIVRWIPRKKSFIRVRRRVLPTYAQQKQVRARAKKRQAIASEREIGADERTRTSTGFATTT